MGAAINGILHECFSFIEIIQHLGKRDKMRGVPSILSLLRNEFDNINNTRAGMLDYIYHYEIYITLKSDLCRKKNIINLVIMHATL